MRASKVEAALACPGPRERADLAITAHSARAPAARKQKIEPRGLRREDAARYVGVSPTTFDTWIIGGLMPKSKRIGGVVLWDRQGLDTAFDALPGGSETNQDDIWNQVAA